MKYGSINLLLLSDFVKVNQNNQVIGMIICPIMVLCCVFLLVVFIKRTKNIEIPYIDKGNTVQIYNSPELCSLVINGKIVDFYYGLVACNFTLRYKIEDEYGKVTLVEARMGSLYMKLFVDGKLVGKKFMG